MEAISCHELSYTYADGSAGLTNVSFTVDAGESVALMGPNGAGKTTLIYHLNGILPVKPLGNILINSIPLTEKTLLTVRSHVGVVFQNSDNQLFMNTVSEDIAFAPVHFGAENVDALVSQALAATSTTHLQHKHPLHLSLGEKKLVALAGILAQQPDILVLDEPAAGLDAAQKSAIVRLLKGLTCTKLLVTHELNIARALCTRVLILYKGALVVDGPITLLDDRELLRKYSLLEEF